MTTTDRTVAAEARAVEEGHHAILGHDERGSFVRVVSDLLGHTGKGWLVRVSTAGPGCPLVFSCDPDREWRDGHKHLSSVDGATPCKHMALAARRLEREGFARLLSAGVHGDIVLTHSRWVATDKALPVEQNEHLAKVYQLAAEGRDGNPFDGF